MYIGILADVKVSLFMKDYIVESTGLFSEELGAAVLILSKKGLQNINDSSTRVGELHFWLDNLLLKLCR